MFGFEDLTALLKNNQFASGGIVMVVLGAMVASLRRWPSQIWWWLRRQFIVTIDVDQNDPAFRWVVKYLDAHQSAKRSRSMMVNSMWNDEGHFDIRMGLAVGKHLIFEKRRPIWIDRTRKDLTGAVWGPAHSDTFRFQTLGRDKEFLLGFMDRAKKAWDRMEPGKVRLYVSQGNTWQLRVVPSVKRMESVILTEGLGEKILQDTKWFGTARGWYEEKGIPYRRGYLLYGKPGCGKTSLILALAAELDAAIYMLSTGDRDLTDQILYTLISTIKPNSLLVIEDVDAAFRNRNPAPLEPQPQPTTLGGPSSPVAAVVSNGITFSGLLNSIDGILGGDGRLLLMTTNHPDRLDPAIVRPGRVDLKVELGHADKSQARRLFLRFYPDYKTEARVFADTYEEQSMSPAELQELFLRNAEDPAQALRDYMARSTEAVPAERKDVCLLR